jgi:hypothetical protein
MRNIMIKDPVVLSDSCQEFMGFRYYKCGPYLSRQVEDNKRCQLHRDVWEAHNGMILDTSMCIHHINGNKLDNSIDNLEMMSRSDHMALHQTEDIREAARVRMRVVQDAAKSWHGSEEGLRWHSINSYSTLHKAMIKQELVCRECGIIYEIKAPKRFGESMAFKYCDNNCKMKAYRRRRSGAGSLAVDMETATEKQCLHCGSCYWTNKPRVSKYCSTSCMQKYLRTKKRATIS